MVRAFPVFKKNSGCDYHRVELPFRYSHGLNDNEPYRNFNPEKLFEYLSISDVVVYNRYFPLGTEAILNARKKHGFKIVVDVDDWVILPYYHPLYKRYKEEDARLILEAVESADLVTVTTERLYLKYKEYNPNIEIIPNALPYGCEQFTVKERQENGDFNFVYTGQTSHVEDVRMIQSSVQKSRSINNVSFSLAGFKPNPAWFAMEKVFSRAKNYIRIENRSLYDYMDVYDQADCSLVPLCINDFNFCKSNLKLLEAAAKKIPAIVSHVPPYRDDKDAPVLWVKEPGDWYKHFKYLSENRDKAKDLGQQLHEWAVEKYNLLKWNKTRFDIYSCLNTR